MEYRARSLDEWYRIVNKMYLDRNFYRHPESLFTHLVEIVGGLSLLASDKAKPGVDPQSYMAKAIAWWCALCGKMRIRSVEQMIWAKFPGVCPYCQKSPHKNADCRKLKKQNKDPDWTTLRELAEKNVDKRPSTLGGWLAMFTKIYDPQPGEQYPATFARFTEELGELAEATRLFQLAPGYFFSEAADFFAWLMHLQALLLMKNEFDGNEGDQLERAMWSQYPGRCKDCGNALCNCPPVLRKTFGRIAHEMPLINGGTQSKPLLDLSEAMDVFELSSKEVTLGGKQIEVTLAAIKDIHAVVDQMRDQLKELKGFGEAHTVTLIDILNDTRLLLESERITQESMDALTKAISALPSERRDALLSWLSGLSSSVWASALVEGVKALAG